MQNFNAKKVKQENLLEILHGNDIFIDKIEDKDKRRQSDQVEHMGEIEYITDEKYTKKYDMDTALCTKFSRMDFNHNDTSR